MIKLEEKPTFQQQWPIFELTDSDLQSLWVFHVASLEGSGDKPTPTVHADEEDDDCEVLRELSPFYCQHTVDNYQYSEHTADHCRTFTWQQIALELYTVFMLVFFFLQLVDSMSLCLVFGQQQL